MPAADLEIRNLTKRYQTSAAAAVNDLNMTVSAGRFVSLLGASGSGKTTTLMMVAGFIEPTSGEIRIGGQSVTRTPSEKRNVGVVFQNYALFPHMTAEQNVLFPLEMRRVPVSAGRRIARSTLELVGLSGLEKRFPHELSGGQQQRVALARAIVFSPSILLMDEPLGALDKQLRERMQRELRALQRDIEATTLYVTHDQSEALSLSDVVAVMREGRLEQVAPPAQLFMQPANRFVASFIGACNLLEAQAAPRNDRTWEVSVCGYRGVVNGPGPALGSEPTLAVRPHTVDISPNSRDGLSGHVTETVFLGEVIETTVRLACGAVVTARQPADGINTPVQGSPVIVSWRWEQTWLV